jgi:hypothetical protein
LESVVAFERKTQPTIPKKARLDRGIPQNDAREARSRSVPRREKGGAVAW